MTLKRTDMLKEQEDPAEVLHSRLLCWRDISDVEDVVCRDCRGSGVKTYSCTSTWRGGIGGQAITSDVCDRCWGSGAENRPWTNLRQIDKELP